MSRKVTNQIYDLIDEGILTYQQIAEACLCYMSEDDVADMAHCNELLRDNEETIEQHRLAISRSDDLDELCDVLNEALNGLSFDDYSNLNTTSLPTFGGGPPADTSEVYSWDETRLLIFDSKWSIVKRDQ